MKNQNVAAHSMGGVILAAGKGTRMYSSKPKVLQEILGETMLGFVYAAMETVVGANLWTVVGFGADQVSDRFPERADTFVLQKEQCGTGHALQCAWPRLRQEKIKNCLVVNGDTPLLTAEVLNRFAAEAIAADVDLAFMSLELDDPGAYGRVVRTQDGDVAAIIEAKDYDPAVHGPDRGEVNAGIYFLRMDPIEPLLDSITCDNAQGEFYITQLIDLARDRGLKVAAIRGGGDENLMGVNSPAELVHCEEILRQRIVESLKQSGVIVRQGESVRVGPRSEFEPGAALTGPCEVYGTSRIMSGATVESHCWIQDSVVGSGAYVRTFSHLEKVSVGEGCRVGPYARLRPGTELLTGASVGNFVEVKNAQLRAGVKAGHLSYIGDATVGEATNIGAGTITCNYDGKSKHRTVIKAGAFIGSNTALVAPVTVGENVVVGAGSTITKDVPDGALAIGRAKQTNLQRRNR